MTRLNSRLNEQYYTQANTARKLNMVPETIERPEERRRDERAVKGQPNKQISKNA